MKPTQHRCVLAGFRLLFWQDWLTSSATAGLLLQLCLLCCPRLTEFFDLGCWLVETKASGRGQPFFTLGFWVGLPCPRIWVLIFLCT